MAAGLLLPGRALAGDDGPPPGAGSPGWDGQTYRHIADPRTGISFDVPILGFRLESRHFDQKTPSYRIKDSFTIWGPEGLEVMIDVFDNPKHLTLEGFFDANLGFMRGGQTAVSDGTVGQRQVAALLVEQPEGPGAYGQVAAVFALGGHVFRVTCTNEEDERAVKVYLHVLDTLEVGKDAQ